MADLNCNDEDPLKLIFQPNWIWPHHQCDPTDMSVLLSYLRRVVLAGALGVGHKSDKLVPVSSRYDDGDLWLGRSAGAQPHVCPQRRLQKATGRNCFIPPVVAPLAGNSIKSASVPCYMFYAQLISKTNTLIR